jgi:hypothetical protein
VISGLSTSSGIARPVNLPSTVHPASPRRSSQRFELAGLIALDRLCDRPALSEQMHRYSSRFQDIESIWTEISADSRIWLQIYDELGSLAARSAWRIDPRIWEGLPFKRFGVSKEKVCAAAKTRVDFRFELR